MKRQGFTMIEMLVVIAIICICVTLTIPSFVEAQRAAGLRTSAQTLIMTAKYARSMSILKQIDMALVVYRGEGRVELVSFADSAANADQSGFLDQRNAHVAMLDQSVSERNASGDSIDTNEAPPPPPAIKVELLRELADDITIKELEVEGQDDELDDTSWVFFHRNGTSSGFKISIADSRGSIAVIEMDGISGLVKSKMVDRKDL